MSRVPIRDVRWACDCTVGGGDREALVHHQGCASQIRRAEAAILLRGRPAFEDERRLAAPFKPLPNPPEENGPSRAR